MADTAAPAKPAAASSGGQPWFARKVGPLPVWAYGLIAVGAYYWYTHYGPGASKGTPAASGQQDTGQQPGTYSPTITETINYRGRTPRPGKRKPGRDQTTAQARAPIPTPGPAGDPDKRDRDRRDKDKRDRDKRDRDKRPPGPGPAPGPDISQTVDVAPPGGQPAATGQPVDASTGQPVYWEWTHAHRPPEVAYPVTAPVPEPQPAYAPQTSGAIYDATTAAAAAAG